MTFSRLSAHSALTFSLALAWPLGAQPPGHGFHPPMPDQQFVLQCRLEPDGGGAPLSVETPLPLGSPLAPAALSQTVTVPNTGTVVHVKRYLPRATLEQEAVPDETVSARPAVELSIDGPTQSFRRWLLAGDAERNRLVSFIATWRYLAVADRAARDALFQQFTSELTRGPVLEIARPDGSGMRTLPAEPGRVESLDELGCKLRVLEFFGDYGRDEKSGRPVNRSPRRLNPAALVEIEQGGQKEQRWLFAKFPDFRAEAGKSPVRLTLNCPLENQGKSPDFAVISVGETHEVWVRHEGRTSVRPLTLDQPVEVAGSQYTFRIARFIASARLREHYAPAERKGTVSALEVEVLESAAPARPLWLESGKQRAVRTSGGLLLLAFGPRGQVGGSQETPSPHSTPPRP